MSAVTAPDEPSDAPPPEAPDMASPPLARETDTAAPPLAPQAAALPAGSGALDSATVQRIVDRLVALHYLTNAAEAQNPDAMVQAIKDFQSGAGISPSGTLDRDTIGRLTTP